MAAFEANTSALIRLRVLFGNCPVAFVVVDGDTDDGEDKNEAFDVAIGMLVLKNEWLAMTGAGSSSISFTRMKPGLLEYCLSIKCLCLDDIFLIRILWRYEN